MKFLIQLLRSNRVLVLSVVFCLCLSIIRVQWTDKIGYLFLVWNLFLAMVPWMISSLMTHRYRLSGQVSLRSFVLLAPLWLLFFPNAPYIITDLFHLRYLKTPAIWFDVMLVMSYAWTGLLIGLRSLSQMEVILGQWFSRLSVVFFSTFVLFLSAFGIYLGRFLRWNSWDILNDPVTLLGDIKETLFSPSEHFTAWGVTLIMGALLNLMYWGLKHREIEKNLISPDQDSL